MKTREWKFRDEEKKKWGEGPWINEPDKVQWKDEATGLPCLIVRGPAGALCGYVGVSESNRFYGKDYSDCTLPTAKPRGKIDGDEKFIIGEKQFPNLMIERTRKQLICNEEWCRHQVQSLLEVHGGITFSDSCQDRELGVCHIVEPGESDKVWWIGFDCGHGGDVIPGFMEMREKFGIKTFTGENGETYKDVAYVMNECADLAKQLASEKWADLLRSNVKKDKE